MPPRAPSSVPFAYSAAVGAALGALYFALAPHVTGNKDAAEFTLALAFAGAPHPTGYPLYTLLGHAFVTMMHRFGASWAYAANAWSATGGAVAMALLHALACRVLPPTAPVSRTGRFLLALLGTLLIGLNPAWMLDAMLAEVYSWHLAWVCGACLVALGLVRALSRRGEDWTARRLVIVAAGWGLACGIGMSHHVTAVFFVVCLSALIAFAAVRAGQWRWWIPAVACGAALVPLSSYAWIAYRAWHPAVFQWPRLEPTVRSVWRHLTAAEYRDLVGSCAPAGAQADLFKYDIYPVLFPGLLGLLWACFSIRAGTEKWIRWGLFAAALMQTGFGFRYGVDDPSSYFEPNLALATLAVPLIGARMLRFKRALPALTVAACVALAAVAQWWVRFGFAIRTGMEIVERHDHELWSSIPFDRGFVLWRDDRYMTLLTYQLFDRDRPEIFVTDPNALSWKQTRERVIRRFGFDPLAGLTPLTYAKAPLIPENVNRQTPLPVVIFDTSQDSLRPLPKPAPIDSAAIAR
jgi:hypothetical protein